jgi:hypothetical protein
MRLNIFERGSETTEKKTAAWAGLIGGTFLAATSVVGILSNEARSPKEAAGSINFGDHGYFVESEEFPVLVIGIVGVLAAGISIEALRHKDEE